MSRPDRRNPPAPAARPAGFRCAERRRPPRSRRSWSRRSWSPGLGLLLTTLVASAGLEGPPAATPAPPPRQPPAPADPIALEALPEALSFDLALALAGRFNPRLRGLEEQGRERRERRVELRAEALPQLRLDGSLEARDSGLSEAFGPESSPRADSWRGAIGLEQPIYRGGLARATVRAQEHRIAATEETLRAARYDVMLDTARAFCAGLLARDVIDARTAAVEVLERQREEARRRADVGVGSSFDVLQADVALSNARPPLVRARLQYRLAIEELRLAIGLPWPGGLDADGVTLLGDWPFPVLSAAPGEALETALSHRPELAALARERDAAAWDVRAIRATRLPHLTASATYGWNSRQFGDTWHDNLSGWRVGVRASLPLWTSGLAGSREAQARSRERQLLWRETELRAVIEMDVARTLAEWRVAGELYATSADRIRLAEEAQRQARSRFEAGSLPQVEVLLATLELTQARLDRAQAAHDANLAIAQLNRAMGILAVDLEAAP